MQSRMRKFISGSSIRPTAPEGFYADAPRVWQATISSIGALLMVTAGLVVGSVLVGDVSGPPRVVISLLAAITPSAVWLITIYRKRGETSPLVAVVFILAALMAGAITRPMLFDILAFESWMGQTAGNNRFLASIFVLGMWHSFVIYAIVRYTVWRAEVFSKRADGILFGAAAGWGYATAMAMLFAFDHNGLSLVAGNLRVIATHGAYLCPGLIMGYFLGRNRFEDMPFFFLAAGLAISAFLSGLILYGVPSLNSVALSFERNAFSPWPGFMLGIVAVILTTAALIGILRRNNALTRGRLENAA